MTHFLAKTIPYQRLLLKYEVRIERGSFLMGGKKGGGSLSFNRKPFAGVAT